MKSRVSAFSIFLATSLAAGQLQADVIAYPQKGQSSEQQLKDKSYCSQWATQQTGVSPEQLMKQQQQLQQARPAPTTGAGRGAAKGAAVGAIGGAIGGDAGKGAAVGAGVGAAGGGLRKRKQEKEAQQQQQAGQAAANNQLATFEKAQKACLQGKGYGVQ